MIPVFQTIIKVPGGNCFQACVASLLERRLEDVPHFCSEDAHHNWFADFAHWLAKEGHGLIICHPWGREQPEASAIIEGYCILGVVTSPLADPAFPKWLHAVVGKATMGDGNLTYDVVHDPNPNPRKIVEFKDAIFIVKNVA